MVLPSPRRSSRDCGRAKCRGFFFHLFRVPADAEGNQAPQKIRRRFRHTIRGQARGQRYITERIAGRREVFLPGGEERILVSTPPMELMPRRRQLQTISSAVKERVGSAPDAQDLHLDGVSMLIPLEPGGRWLDVLVFEGGNRYSVHVPRLRGLLQYVSRGIAGRWGKRVPPLQRGAHRRLSFPALHDAAVRQRGELELAGKMAAAAREMRQRQKRPHACSESRSWNQMDGFIQKKFVSTIHPARV